MLEDDVIATIRSIAAGEVMTYGEVAAESGYPGAARAVGNLLAVTAEDVPWWRVVGSGGHLRSPDKDEQAARLAAEGWRLQGKRLLA